MDDALGPLMAAATLALAPILVMFIILQRWIVASLTMTGLKG